MRKKMKKSTEKIMRFFLSQFETIAEFDSVM
jgi:hypothetical protein